MAHSIMFRWDQNSNPRLNFKTSMRGTRIFMSIKRIILFAMGMVAIWGSLMNLYSQIGGEAMPFSASRARQMFGPPLFLYASNYFLDDSAKADSYYRLDVTVAFANDLLQFVKERQANFNANYELYARVFDTKGNLIAERNAGNQITVSDFKSTNDRDLSNRHQLSFRLRPGRYKLSLDLVDLDTQKNLHREQELILPRPDRTKVTMSEIVFADEIVADSLDNVQHLNPNLSRHFDDDKRDFWAYFEIYPASIGGEVKCKYLIRDANDQVVGEHQQFLRANRMVIPVLIQLNAHVKASGRFSLEVQLEQQQLNANARARFSTSFTSVDPSPLSLQTRIETLKEYVAEKEFKNLLQAPDSLKAAWLRAFWKQRDPTPDTEYNELQQEFYRRVEFANSVFTINALDKEGWKTDRGSVYIKYGPPTEVERHQEQLNLPPYEIWYYSKLDQRFFFQDKTGMGDFQLVRIE